VANWLPFTNEVLMHCPASVKEVAFMLDYEKVSNFIDMFKKFHGISPGVLRRTVVSS
jgi:AraC-like DNA-binding protein